MNSNYLRFAVAAALAGTAGTSAQLSWAQQAGAGALEEIVVTATRREVSLQDVPLAITALTEDSMRLNNIENAGDLKAVVPNVMINGTGGGTTNASVTMRGIPNVGTYIDGIWQVTSNGGLERQFVELDRVEVLRGPQGTLYGRDSTGGSIHLYTALPDEEFGATVDVGVGSLDRQDVRASVDIPFGENFRSRWTVASYDHGGFVNSLVTGIKHGSFQDDVTRGDIVWTPSDRAQIRLIYQEDDIIQRQARIQNFISFESAWVQGFQVGVAEAIDIASRTDPSAPLNDPASGFYHCETQCSGYPGGSLDEYDTYSETTTPTRQNLEQLTFSVDFDISEALHFRYLYGDTDVDSRLYNDWDATQYNLFVNYNPAKLEMESHELQFSGGNDRISWVAGYYTWDQWERQRTTEWAMTDWVGFNKDSGQPVTLDYADVLANEACTTRTPASLGFDFSFVDEDGMLQRDPNTIDGWPVRCQDGPMGAGWVGRIGADPGDDLVQETQDGEAYFGEITVGLTDRLDLTLGARYHEQDAADAEVNLANAVASGAAEPRPITIDTEYRPGDWVWGGEIDPTTSLAASFDETTYRYALSYSFSDGIIGYVSYSEGFNSGGVDSITDSVGRRVEAYPPEFIENTEVGLRSDLLGGRLRLNATYFTTDWNNIQLAATVVDRQTGAEATELLTQAAASATADGFEVEVNYAATNNLLIDGTLGFLNTEYTESIAPGLPLGTEFAQAPDNTYSFGLTHNADMSNGGTLTTRISATYWDTYWRVQNPALRQDRWVSRTAGDEGGDIWMVNARLAYTPPGGGYELSLWGSNLLDEYNRNSGFMHGIWQFDFATLDRPREAGVSLRMFF